MYNYPGLGAHVLPILGTSQLWHLHRSRTPEMQQSEYDTRHWRQLVSPVSTDKIITRMALVVASNVHVVEETTTDVPIFLVLRNFTQTETYHAVQHAVAIWRRT